LINQRFAEFSAVLLVRKECEEEERRAREDIERLRLAEAAQLQQEEKQRQVLQECVGISQLLLLLLLFSVSILH